MVFFIAYTLPQLLLFCVTQLSISLLLSVFVFFFFWLGSFGISYTFCLFNFASLMSPHCDILRNAEDSALAFFLSLAHLAHISFLFTSLPCTSLCFVYLPYRISHKKSLYMPKNTLTPAVWDSSTWAKEDSRFPIFRNKQRGSTSEHG